VAIGFGPFLYAALHKLARLRFIAVLFWIDPKSKSTSAAAC